MYRKPSLRDKHWIHSSFFLSAPVQYPVSSIAKLRIIMTTALKHSMGALFWAFVILIVAEVMLALLLLTCRQPEKMGWVLRLWCRGMGHFQLPRLGQLAITFLQADEGFDQDIEVEIKFFEYFGTFPRRSLVLCFRACFLFLFVSHLIPKSQYTVYFDIFGVFSCPSGAP